MRDTASINDIEREYLLLVCKGYTSKEISIFVFKGVRTVDGYRDSLFTRFGCHSMPMLIAKLFREGILH